MEIGRWGLSHLRGAILNSPSKKSLFMLSLGVGEIITIRKVISRGFHSKL